MVMFSVVSKCLNYLFVVFVRYGQTLTQINPTVFCIIFCVNLHKNIKDMSVLISLILLFSFAFDNLGGNTELMLTRAVAQDDDGMIWFGTDRGLQSYDGYDFRSYPCPDGKKLINAIYVKGDYIYIGSNEGLHLYNKLSGEHQTIDFFSNEAVRCLEANADKLFVGTNTGLYLYKCDRPLVSTSISKISAEEIYCMSIFKNDLWIGTTEGLARYDINRMTYVKPAIEYFKNEGIKVVTTLWPQNDSTVWFGNPTSLIKADVNSGDCSVEAKLPVLKSLLPGLNGVLHVGTDDGLYLYDMNNKVLTKMKDVTIWDSMTDSHGDMWFATDSGLLFKSQSSGLSFLDTGNVSENAMYSKLLSDSHGRLWIGSTYGLLLYEPDKNGGYRLVQHYSMGEGKLQIPHNRVNAITENIHSKAIYIATDGGNLMRDFSSAHFERLPLYGISNWFYDILIDGDNIWYASFDGLHCVTDGRLDRSWTTDDGFTTNDIAQVVKDRYGQIWARTRDQKVFVLTIDTGVLEQFEIGEYADSHFAECIASDLEGNIWISSQNELIHVVNDTVNNVYPMYSRNPLEIYSMSDFKGMLWVCSSEGIYMLDKITGRLRNKSTDIRYLKLEYDRVNGNVIMGGKGNVSYCSFENFEKLFDDVKGNIYITSVIVNSEEVVALSDISLGELILKNDQNNLSISVTDYEYSSSVPSNFHMKLRYKNSDWNEFVSGNTIFLPNLAPGKYELYVSSGDMSLPDENPHLIIIIKRPWYFSWPMLTVYSLLLSLILVLIVQFFTTRKNLVLEREQRESLLEQARQKEAFFGNIAHEFKTPLSLIIAPLGKLINDADDEESCAMLKMAHENATKLNSLVHHTIDYYKKPGTDEGMILSEVEMVSFIRNVFFSYRDHYPNHEFIFNSEEPGIIAEVDIVKMEMILSNLMSNACKFTPEGGSVIMTLEREAEKNLLYVKLSDTGIGIPKEELHLVFQRYYESSRSKGRHYDSTGIGLSIIKKYVQKHGGSVFVDSDDNGTTFTVVMPCKPIQDNVNVSLTSSAQANKPLVVVVDDNPQVCSFMMTVLEAKYRCICANNGKSGLKLCKDVFPDLIISDVMMPVMDGMEMCRLIREFSPLSAVPIILLTAKDDKETEMQSIGLNIDAFIPKPFDFAKLSARIDQLIGNKKRMEQKMRLDMMSLPVEKQELSHDEKYLKKITQVIEEHIDDDTLSVRKLCELGDFNEKQMYRKIKMLTGMSTVEYIRSIRLKKAAILLQKGTFTVSEVMYSVGFSNASYFTRSFSAEYGSTPSEYMKSYKTSE